MFRNLDQQSRACRALLQLRSLVRFWSDVGPTEEGFALAEDIAAGRRSALSSGEGALVLAAMTFWTGNRWGLDFADVLGRLDGAALTAVTLLALATAESPDAIDQWLTVYGGSPHGDPRPRLSWTNLVTYAVFDAAERRLAGGFVSVDDAIDACVSLAKSADGPLRIRGSNGDELRCEG